MGSDSSDSEDSDGFFLSQVPDLSFGECENVMSQASEEGEGEIEEIEEIEDPI